MKSRYWTFPARSAISRAWFEAMQFKSPAVTPDHLLLGILVTDGKARQLVGTLVPTLEPDIRALLSGRSAKKPFRRADPRLVGVLKSAKRIAQRRRDPAVGTVHLLSAITAGNPTLKSRLAHAFCQPDSFDLAGELAQGKLIRNERWHAQYVLPNGSTFHYSKFGIGEAAMSFSTLKRLWPKWDQVTRSQFAMEFNSQCNWLLGSNEKSVAKFVAASSEGPVRVNASSFLLRMPGAQAYPIIRRWLAETEEAKANLYQILQAKAFRRLGVVSLLKSELERHLVDEERWRHIGANDHDQGLLNAVGCVQALWHHDRNSRYRRLLLSFSRHRNRLASAWAKSTLKETAGPI